MMSARRGGLRSSPSAAVQVEPRRCLGGRSMEDAAESEAAEAAVLLSLTCLGGSSVADAAEGSEEADADVLLSLSLVAF